MRDLFVKYDIALHDRILLLLVVLNPQRLNKLPNIKRESILKNFRHTNNKLVRFFPSRIKYAKNSLAQSVRDAWLRRGKRQFLVTSICLSYLFVLAWVLQLFPLVPPLLLQVFFLFSLRAAAAKISLLKSQNNLDGSIYSLKTLLLVWLGSLALAQRVH